MNGLRVVAERGHGVALGITARFRAFGPSVAVGVERDAGDAETGAALLKFGGAVAGADGGEIGKERPDLRQLFK